MKVDGKFKEFCAMFRAKQFGSTPYTDDELRDTYIRSFSDFRVPKARKRAKVLTIHVNTSLTNKQLREMVALAFREHHISVQQIQVQRIEPAK